MMPTHKTPTLVDTQPSNPHVHVESVQTTPFSLNTKMRMRLWGIISATLFRYSPPELRAFRRLLLKLFGAKLADTASIHNRARIDFPWNLAMGERSSIGEDTWIYALDKIVIGNYACVGQQVRILTGTHDYHDPSFPLVTHPVVIGYGSWIAVGVTVLPGTKIGALTVVGAASVVTNDLPEATVCAGNPCRPIKPRTMRTQPAGE